MHYDYHDFFDLSELCLVPTNQPGVYTIRFYMDVERLGILALDQIIFMDDITSVHNPHSTLLSPVHPMEKTSRISSRIWSRTRMGMDPPERIFGSCCQFLYRMEARASV